MAEIKITVKKDKGINVTSKTGDAVNVSQEKETIDTSIKKETPVVAEQKKEEIKVEQKKIEILHSSNHALLENLEFEKSGHIGFQKQLEYDEDLKCYLVET